MVVSSLKRKEHQKLRRFDHPSCFETPRWASSRNLSREDLFDVAVRPAYAGGVRNVLSAYKAGVERVSIPEMIRIIQGANHAYPYHQAVGFYMEHAGKPLLDLAPLRDMGLNFDFYLDNKMPIPKYNQSWRIFVPSDLI